MKAASRSASAAPCPPSSDQPCRNGHDDDREQADEKHDLAVAQGIPLPLEQPQVEHERHGPGEHEHVAIQCSAALSQCAIEASEVENPAVETVVSACASASNGVIATSQ